MDDQPEEYCVVHDHRLRFCKDPDRCREIMTAWGLYNDKTIHGCRDDDGL